MKTQKQIIKILKDKLNVDNENIAKVIKLARPIFYTESYLKIRLTLISYEKRRDTIWLLGNSNLGQFAKVTIHEALKNSITSHIALDDIVENLEKIQPELIDLPKTKETIS